MDSEGRNGSYNPATMPACSIGITWPEEYSLAFIPSVPFAKHDQSLVAT